MNHAFEDVKVLVFERFQYKLQVIFPILFNVSQTQAPDTFPQLNTHKNCFKGLQYYKSITILPQINKFHLFRKFKFLQGKTNFKTNMSGPRKKITFQQCLQNLYYCAHGAPQNYILTFSLVLTPTPTYDSLACCPKR